MKKQLLSRKRLLAIFYSLCLMLCVNLGWGQQQTIGSFPYMEGGFENADPGLALGTGGSTTLWTKQTSSFASTISSATPRTGAYKGLVTLSGASAARFLMSPSGPTTPVRMTINTSYIVQLYVKNSVAIPSFQTGFSVN
jgi:hypothetical protein